MIFILKLKHALKWYSFNFEVRTAPWYGYLKICMFRLILIPLSYKLEVFNKDISFSEVMVPSFSLWTYEEVSNEPAVPTSPEPRFYLFHFYWHFDLTKVDAYSPCSCWHSMCKPTLQVCTFMSPWSAVGHKLSSILPLFCSDHALIPEIYDIATQKSRAC